MGDHTVRVAAEAGDGWIPALVARDRLPAWTERLIGHEAAELGKSPPARLGR